VTDRQTNRQTDRQGAMHNAAFLRESQIVISDKENVILRQYNVDKLHLLSWICFIVQDLTRQVYYTGELDR